MKLYQIDAAMQELIDRGTDPETGELTIDPAELESLQMAREDKLENIALHYKNLTAEAAEIKIEESKLVDRRHSLERTAERMKKMLDDWLAGEKFSTARVAVSFKTSKPLELNADIFMPWACERPEYLRFKPPEPDKTAIKDAIKRGVNIPGAQITEKRNVIIK